MTAAARRISLATSSGDLRNVAKTSESNSTCTRVIDGLPFDLAVKGLGPLYAALMIVPRQGTAAAALAPLPFELVLDDGEPLETDWHTVELPLPRKLILLAMEEQARTDFFVGANIFVYYSVQQAQEVWARPWSPDLFLLTGSRPGEAST